MIGERLEIAKQKVARFAQRFRPSLQEPYRRFACFAALPLILTPELLNYLRNHYLKGEVPWVAESDLLLSELCRPVGYEQFVMAQDVRAYLIEEMRERDGEERLQDVARLLIRYVIHLSRAGSPFSQGELHAEQWSAMAYLSERREEAARQIAESFRTRLMTETSAESRPTAFAPRAELARLVRITRDLAPQLSEYPELIGYAAEIGRILASPADAPSLSKVLSQGIAGRPLTIAGISLPSIGSAGAIGEIEGKDEERPTEKPTLFRDAFLNGKGNGPEMLWLPGGTFTMGDDKSEEKNEKPAHRVTLDHFAAAKYPVTVGEFRRFVEATDYKTEAETGDGAYVYMRR